MTLRLATWNINSVRLRLPMVSRFAKEHKPDIICLQETKAADAHFPADDLKQMGYPHIAFFGQKSYNGVAVLSKKPFSEVREEGFAGTDHKRHIMVRLGEDIWLHNFYVPAGGDIPDPTKNPKFDFKLKYLDAMRDYFAEKKHNGGKAILVGDLNIAPGEHDVWSHKQMLKIVSHTPVEVEKLAAVQQTQGWLDCARVNLPLDEKIYSWWSYRARDWEKSDRGRRLDHIWLTPALSASLGEVHHARHMRGWEKPSDHVPVIADLKLEC